MKPIHITLLLVICLINLVPLVQCQRIPVVFKRVNCGALCTYSLCMQQTIEDCKANEVLIPADGDCYCCNTCVKREKFRNRCRCNREDCYLMDCRDLTPDSCLEENMAFVPRDGKCLCCDQCVKPKPRPNRN